MGRPFGFLRWTQGVENPRDLRLLGQPRMAAGEHHAQQVVFDCVRGKEFIDDRRECPFSVATTAGWSRDSAASM